jgi:predicted ATPase/class 3 adenylate cyclase/Tfp pilus assembly protein PilF
MHDGPTGTTGTTGTPRPSGTVTFLFTDIEGSTRRWESNAQAMQLAFSRQEAILRQTIDANGGYAYKMIGDAFQAAFPTASQALRSAIDAQLALHSESWPEEIGEIKVRMALHSGATEERADDYVGPALNRVARLLSTGHGGQVLLTFATAKLVRDSLPVEVSLLDMGEHCLKDLTTPEHIFQLVTADLPTTFPPLKTLDNRPNNLPVQPTPLVGRVKELAELQEMLGREEARLATLTGPGGTGKTRLGLQVAAEVLDDYRDGVWFVDLSPLMDSGLVVPTIASVLDVKETGGGQPIIDTLKEYLKGKSMLLVLDNFEQVVGAAKDVSTLLASSSSLKVLVTSRVPLRIRGEKEYAVPPLSVPDAKHLPQLDRLTQYDAVRLFIERATDVKADFQMTNDNAPTVAEICVRLDGLPLAIELAAARIKMLPPRALLTRLSQALKVLVGGAKDLPERQQTLHATIEWSYDLLSEGEKQIFRRMAPFSGGRILEAVEQVCNANGDLKVDVLDGITSLLDKSLMYTVDGAEGGEPRYIMLETIHEYAREKLQGSGEGEYIRRQHALYFMRLAEEAEGELRGPQQTEWLARLEDEYDNIRAALQWARETGESRESISRHKGDVEALADVGDLDDAAEIGLRIVGAIWRFWLRHGYFSEGREQLAIFLEKRKKRPKQEEEIEGKEEETIRGLRSELGSRLEAYKAKALNGAGVLASLQGDYGAARSLYEESLSLYRELGDKRGISGSLSNLGIMAQQQGDYAAARSLYEESLALSRESGNKRGISISLNNLGIVVQHQGDYGSARSLYEESLALSREVGDITNIAGALNSLGLVAQLQGDYGSARSLYGESLSLYRELEDKWGIALALLNLGHVTQLQGDYGSARSLYEESLSLFMEIGDMRDIAETLAGLAGLTVRRASAISAEDAGGRAGARSAMAMEGEEREYGEEGKQRLLERGAKLLGAVEALLQSIGAVLDPEYGQAYERAIAIAREELGEEGLEAARQEGRSMSMQEAIEYALKRSPEE